MERLIDLSCDLGEAATAEERQVEEQLWPMITAANVACGGHAGDAASMREAARQARELGVVFGAHPSYPDRENFGRKSMSIAAGALRESLVEQIESLRGIAAAERIELRHVKPHGALYNDAHRDAALARTIVEAILRVSPAIAVVAAPRSALYDAALAAGLPVVAEAFGDRRYRVDGSLVPRSEPDALLLDPEEAADQALLLGETGRVRTAAGGREVEVPFATLCIHADMPRSAERLITIRQRLRAAGFDFSARARMV